MAPTGPIVMVKAQEPLQRRTLCRQVAAVGHKARNVETTSAVLASLAGSCVEAFIWVEDGGESAAVLFERLREHESDLCVIIIGPEVGAERVSAYLKSGAFDYLVMPVQAARLKESLRQGLDIRRSFREVRGLSGRLQRANEELARERDSLRRLNHGLVLLNQLGQAMSAAHGMDDIVRTVAERLSEIVPYDVLTVKWRDPERIWVYTGNGSESLPSASDTRQERRRNKSPSTIDRYLIAAHSENGSSVDAIDAPLLSGAAEMGRFILERFKGAPFGQADRELMAMVATSLALSMANAEAQRNLEQMAMKDGLTNLFNRRAFDHLLNREIKAAERYGSPVCLLLTDIDHFKDLNDRFGHAAGDAVLKEVAALLSKSLRDVDIVARYGGEEFAIVLPRTDLAAAVGLADRIRERVRRHVFMVGRSRIRLTLSFGVAGFLSCAMRTKEDLVEAADRALYRAKALGRNRVERYEESSPGRQAASAYAQLSWPASRRTYA